MDYEHRLTLEKTIVSQTWNNQLVEALISAIEEDLKTPKCLKSPSALTIALNAEKTKAIKSSTSFSDDYGEL